MSDLKNTVTSNAKHLKNTMKVSTDEVGQAASTSWLGAGMAMLAMAMPAGLRPASCC